MKINQPESLKQNIDKLIQIKESMKQNKPNNGPKPKNSGNNKKKCKTLPEFDPESNKRKEELLDLLIKMNGNLFGNKQSGKIITALLKVMDNEQKTLKERQKIISGCLDHYNEILENYYDQSIKLDNLEKIAQSLSLSKNKASPQQVIYKA